MFGAALRPLWRFGPEVVYLNHGAFGATPAEVLEAQAGWRDRIEAAPGPFLSHEYPALIRRSADAVAAAFGARGDDLVFVENATAGINAVLASLPLAPGDEVLVTRHTYGAIRNAATHWTRRAGARLTVAAWPFPPAGPDEVVAAVERMLSPRTRLALLDHIVSETGMVLPIAELAAVCRSRGVPVLVDGAHAPGQVALDLPALGVSWYTGNLHKWAFAARGCGFLWAAPEVQGALHPPVVSWGLDGGFTAEFDWIGSRDVTPWLAAPAALAFLERLGPDRVRNYNGDLVREAGRLLAEMWGVELVTPDAMTAAMLLVPLPGDWPGTVEAARAVHNRLWAEHRIHAGIFPVADRLWVRLSAQVYNGLGDYEALGRAL